MKFFKEKTIGNLVVMGRKTWESLPKKPLEGRQNLVITNSLPDNVSSQTVFWSLDTFVKSELDFYNKYRDIIGYDIYIIGGASIYEQLLPYCDKAYITVIHKSHNDVDAYFPNLETMKNWVLTEETPYQEYKSVQFNFRTYERRK